VAARESLAGRPDKLIEEVQGFRGSLCAPRLEMKCGEIEPLRHRRMTTQGLESNLTIKLCRPLATGFSSCQELEVHAVPLLTSCDNIALSRHLTNSCTGAGLCYDRSPHLKLSA